MSKHISVVATTRHDHGKYLVDVLSTRHPHPEGRISIANWMLENRVWNLHFTTVSPRVGDYATDELILLTFDEETDYLLFLLTFM